MLTQTLGDLVEHWLQLKAQPIEEVMDLTVLEQFLADLGGSTQCWVRRHQLKNVEEALCLAEDYVMAEGEGPKKECPGKTGAGSHLEGPSKGKRGETTQVMSRESWGWDAREITCCQCGEKGHIS